MSFISKAELKYQLEKMGINLKGNYVKKRDIKKIIESGSESAHKFFIVYKDKASPFKKDSSEEFVLDGFASEEEAKKNLPKWKREYDAYIVNYDPTKK